MIEQLFRNGVGSLRSGIRQALDYSRDSPLRIPDYKPVIFSLHHGFEMLLKVIVGAKCEGYLKKDFTFEDILAARGNRLPTPKPKNIVTFLEALRRAIQLAPSLAVHQTILSTLNSERNDYYHSFRAAVMDGDPIHTENSDQAEKAMLSRDKFVFCQSIPIARMVLKIISQRTSVLRKRATSVLDFGRLTLMGAPVDPLDYVAKMINSGQPLADINGAKRLALAQMYYYPRKKSFRMMARMQYEIRGAVNKAKEKDADSSRRCPVCGEKFLLWGERDDDAYYLTRGECLACGLELGWHVQKLFKP